MTHQNPSRKKRTTDKDDSSFIRDPFVLDIPMSDDAFFRFCQRNDVYRIEREADGLVLVEEPSGIEYGRRHIRFSTALEIWNEQHNLGIVSDSSVGFTLPNRAVRAPDASWISWQRLEPTTLKDRERFVHAVPEFIIEVRSRTDRMSRLRKKMLEYLVNGMLLGWLVDVRNKVIEIYRPSRDVEVIQGLDGTLSGEEVLPGFVFDLGKLR
jgi:Uma2 family endonuclease